MFLLILATYSYASLANKHERLYETYAQYEDIFPNTKPGEATQTQRAQIALAFQNKTYETVLTLSNAYVEDKPDDIDVLMAKGIAELETRQYRAAMKTFTGLKRQALIGEAKDKPDWYIALTYLRKNDIAYCRTVLHNITKQESTYAKQARKLLNKLPK